MDRSAVQSIVAVAVAAELPRQLGLEGWTITFKFASLPTEGEYPTLGQCHAIADYQVARLDLNPEAFATEAEVLATLRHEFFHLVIQPFELYADAVAAIDLPASTAAALGRVLTHAREQTVLGLERMYANLTTRETP